MDLRNLAKITIDFLLPRYCSVCGKRLHVSEKGICVGCLMDLHLADCADGHKGNTLERTMWLKMPIERAGAFLLYDRDNSQRRIVLDLKYHNRPKLGLHMAALMVERLNTTDFFDSIDLIIPIPISKRRQIQRGYNQSLQIAKGISKLTHIPIDTHTVTRRHYSTSQTKLSPTERLNNVVNTFVLHPNNLQDKHVLIIDDVITTTATVMGCAKVLADIPGIRISVLALAVSRRLIDNMRANNPQGEEPQEIPDQDNTL